MSVCQSVCLSVCRYFMALLPIFPPPSTQACSTAIRDMWAQEIRRLLQDQFTLMKGRYSSQHQQRTCSLLLTVSPLSFPFFPLSPSSHLFFLSSSNLLTSLSLAASLVFHFTLFPLQPSSLFLLLPSSLLLPLLLSPPPSPPLSLILLPSPPPCRQGDKVWHSEQKYLSWQS